MGVEREGKRERERKASEGKRQGRATAPAHVKARPWRTKERERENELREKEEFCNSTAQPSSLSCRITILRMFTQRGRAENDKSGRVCVYLSVCVWCPWRREDKDQSPPLTDSTANLHANLTSTGPCSGKMDTAEQSLSLSLSVEG